MVVKKHTTAALFCLLALWCSVVSAGDEADGAGLWSRTSDYEDDLRGGGPGLPPLFDPEQDSLNVRRVGRGLFEPLGTLYVANDTCYVLSGKDLVLYDVSDETSPVLLSSHRMDAADVREIRAEGPYLYLTTYWEGFQIREKANDFRLAGSYTGGTRMLYSSMDKGRVYINCYEDGVHIVDITEPEEPAFLGKYEREDNPVMSVVRNDTCYTPVRSTGLLVLDVSDPSAVTEIDSLVLTDFPLRLALQDTIVYVTGEKSLMAVDVSDVHEMLEVGRLDVDYYTTLSTLSPVQVHGNYVLITDYYGGLHIINVSDPASMREVGFFPMGRPTDAVFSFPHVFVTNKDGLRVVDVSIPREPGMVGFVDGDHYLDKVEVYDDVAYICGYNSLYGSSDFFLVDVSQPALPRVLTSLEINGANDVHIVYPLAYLGSRTSGFYILDVSDPDSVVQVGHSEVNAWGIDVQFPYAYLAIEHWDNDGLKVLDVSDPDSIVEHGYFPILATYDVFVDGTIAYVASAFDGVYIIDVSDPENPESLSRVPAYDLVSDVHASGNYLYIADGYAGVNVVYVEDPAHPVEVAYSLAGYGNQIHVVEPYLYLAGGSYGMKVLDISVPEEIHEVGYYGKASQGGISADEDYIYMGTLGAGFYVFEFTPTGIVTDDPGTPEILPRTFVLHQNYPNPFNPSTTIRYEVPGDPGEKKSVDLEVYDLRGHLLEALVDGEEEPGVHRVQWDGKNRRGEPVPSGVYLYRITVGEFTGTRKMTVLR